LTSISAKKLSEGLLVSAASRAMVGEATLTSGVAPAGVRFARGAPLTEMPALDSAPSSRAAAKAGGLDWYPRPVSVARPRL
jgi:hypothetical protein